MSNAPSDGPPTPNLALLTKSNRSNSFASPSILPPSSSSGSSSVTNGAPSNTTTSSNTNAASQNTVSQNPSNPPPFGSPLAAPRPPNTGSLRISPQRALQPPSQPNTLASSQGSYSSYTSPNAPASLPPPKYGVPAPKPNPNPALNPSANSSTNSAAEGGSSGDMKGHVIRLRGGGGELGLSVTTNLNSVASQPQSTPGQSAVIATLDLRMNKIGDTAENLGFDFDIWKIKNDGEAKEKTESHIDTEKPKDDGAAVESTPNSRWSFDIEELLLDDNDLVNVPAGMVERLGRVRYISLVKNKISQLTLGPNTLTSLHGLYLSYNLLTDLPDDLNWTAMSRILKLHLNHNGLTRLSPSLTVLTHMEELCLGDNQLTQLPNGLGALINLRTFIVSNNSLSELPEDVSGLVRLRLFDLTGNQLSQLPLSIGRLSHLHDLRVGSNPLHALPHTIARLLSLHSLHFPSAEIETLAPDMAQMTSLRSLNMSSNAVSFVPSAIFSVASLTRLNLSGNRISIVPTAIGQLVRLRQLWFSFNKIATLPNEMSSLIDLEELYIGANMFQSFPLCLLRLLRLKLLNCSDNKITDIPTKVDQMMSLNKLILSSNAVSTVPDTIQALTNLVELNLNSNKLESLPKQILLLKRLRILKVEGNTVLLRSLNVNGKELGPTLAALSNISDQPKQGTQHRPAATFSDQQPSGQTNGASATIQPTRSNSVSSGVGMRFPNPALLSTEQEPRSAESPNIEQGRNMSLEDEYEIGRVIGKGAFAKVRLVKNRKTYNLYAVKIVSKKKFTEADAARIRREIKALRILDHPFVIKLIDIKDEGDHLYIITEYASGGELYQLVESQGSLSEKECRRLFKQIVQGIDYSHSVGVIHRDIKLENILLDEKKNIKIVDYGMCNMKTSPTDKFRTICGSSTYAAPELLAPGAQDYEGRAVDVWALGVVLYSMLSGCFPFDDAKPDVLYKKIMAGKYTQPKASREVRDLIKMIFQTDPLKRPLTSDILASPWFAMSD